MTHADIETRIAAATRAHDALRDFEAASRLSGDVAGGAVVAALRDGWRLHATTLATALDALEADARPGRPPVLGAAAFRRAREGP